MLLNKLPVLDKGFVALYTCSNNGKQLQALQDEYFKANINPRLLNIATATLIIRAPLFFRLLLSQTDLCIVSSVSDTLEAYIPNESDISAGTVEDSKNIKEYIQQTTDALLLNTKGLPKDGCDHFVAQVLTPISTYNEMIVHGSLHNWIKFLSIPKLPKLLKIYQQKIDDVLRTEWPNLHKFKKLT